MFAVIDASTLYGASRYLREVHERPDYEHRESFSFQQDKLLFLEFIHTVLLYDDIVLDNSSIDIDRESHSGAFWSPESPLRKELRPLVERVTERGGPSVSEKDLCFLEERDHSEIKEFVCERLATQVDQIRAYKIPVPWAYNEKHADYHSFKYYCEKHNTPTELVPLALFLYRALIYAAFAKSANAVYLAAPGRLRALDIFLHDMDKLGFDFPRRGYSSALSLLKLPDAGYDFSYLSNTASGAHELSVVSRHISGLSAEAAIEEALKLRNSREGHSLREVWRDTIGRQSSLVGMEQIQITQYVSESNIEGNVIQTVNVEPRYLLARPRW